MNDNPIRVNDNPVIIQLNQIRCRASERTAMSYYQFARPIFLETFNIVRIYTDKPWRIELNITGKL